MMIQVGSVSYVVPTYLEGSKESVFIFFTKNFLHRFADLNQISTCLIKSSPFVKRYVGR